MTSSIKNALEDRCYYFSALAQLGTFAQLDYCTLVSRRVFEVHLFGESCSSKEETGWDDQRYWTLATWKNLFEMG